MFQVYRAGYASTSTMRPTFVASELRTHRPDLEGHPGNFNDRLLIIVQNSTNTMVSYRSSFTPGLPYDPKFRATGPISRRVSALVGNVEHRV
jgi:hypothetical protein